MKRSVIEGVPPPNDSTGNTARNCKRHLSQQIVRSKFGLIANRWFADLRFCLWDGQEIDILADFESFKNLDVIQGINEDAVAQF